MAKKRRRPVDSRSDERASDAVKASSQDNAEQSGCEASSRVQLLVSCLIVFHFGALLLALSANMAPSYLQGELAAWLAPYSVTTGQAYDAVPLELTHAESIDFPLLVELHRSQDGPQDWQMVEPPDVSRSRSGEVNMRYSRWPNLSRLTRLIALDDPESDVLSEIAAQAVIATQQADQDTYDQIRLVAPKVLSFDENSIVAAGQAAFISDELSREVVFSGWIVRDAEQGIKLIPQQDASRTSKPLVSGTKLP
jgi:hypothetical protein